MSKDENTALIRLLKQKSDELNDLSKELQSEKLFDLSCDCAHIANELFHLNIEL